MQNNYNREASDGSAYKIGIVKSRFNEEITKGLLDGCLKALHECMVDPKNIKILGVPGSFEIPLGATRMAETKKYDAIICIGAIIKGGTNHDEYIANACSRGLIQTSLKYNIPVLLGVVTALNEKQAIERSRDNKLNRGYEAAMSAIEMLENLRVM